MEEWNRLWTEVTIPILDELMDDGLLAGWVHLGHNNGGPHNSQFLYLYEDWDDIDDAFYRLRETLARDHAVEWQTIQRLFDAHDDVIWVPTETN